MEKMDKIPKTQFTFVSGSVRFTNNCMLSPVQA